MFGEITGDMRRRPNSRPPSIAAVSPTNVPTQTSMMMPSPWGSSRSSTACAIASPIQARPSIVSARLAGPPGGRWASARKKHSGSVAMKASSTVSRSP